MPAPLAYRLLAVVGGTIASLGLIVVTFGLAVTAPIGMAIMAAVRRRNGRAFTRLASWLAAVSGVAATVLLLFAVGLTLGSGTVMEEMRKSAELERTREPTSFERAVERMSPRTASSEAMERQMEEWTTSETFIWVSLILGSAMGSLMLGALVGSAGWACTMLVVYGTRGRWPGAPRVGVPEAG